MRVMTVGRRRSARRIRHWRPRRERLREHTGPLSGRDEARPWWTTMGEPMAINAERGLPKRTGPNSGPYSDAAGPWNQHSVALQTCQRGCPPGTPAWSIPLSRVSPVVLGDELGFRIRPQRRGPATDSRTDLEGRRAIRPPVADLTIVPSSAATDGTSAPTGRARYRCPWRSPRSPIGERVHG